LQHLRKQNKTKAEYSLQRLRQQSNTKAGDKKMELAERSAKYAERSAKYSVKSAKFVGKKGYKVGRRGMQGAKHLGTSVRSALAGAHDKKSELQPYDDDIVSRRSSEFFHSSMEEEEEEDDFEAQSNHSQPVSKQKKRRSSMSQIPTSQMEQMESFWNANPDDDSSDSSMYNSSSSSDDDSDGIGTSNDGSAVLEVSSRQKTKNIDASDKTEKKKHKKEKKPKANPRRADSAGSTTTDDDESKKKHKRTKQKSKKSKIVKKKKKPKRPIKRSLSDSNLADTLADTETKERKAPDDLLKVVKPPDFNRGDTETLGLSADASTTSFLSFVEHEDREKAVKQIQESMQREMEAVKLQESMQREMEAMNVEKESLQFQLDEETMKNIERTEQINELENELHKRTRGAEQSEELARMYSEVEKIQMELSNEREASEKQASESQKEIEALKSTVDVLKRNDSHTRVLTEVLHEVAPAENKSQGRLQGELLEANVRVAELQRSKKEQEDELVNIREELASHKDQSVIQLLCEQLETAQEQEKALRTELGNVENEWKEKIQCKEETIEFFLKELSTLKLNQATTPKLQQPITPKLQQPTGANGMSTSRLSPEEEQNVLKIQPDAATQPQSERRGRFGFWRR
jgi:hypothetical protein